VKPLVHHILSEKAGVVPPPDKESSSSRGCKRKIEKGYKCFIGNRILGPSRLYDITEASKEFGKNNGFGYPRTSECKPDCEKGGKRGMKSMEYFTKFSLER
jgi:hypothetical protein